MAKRTLGLTESYTPYLQYPSQPLLINILNFSKTGCSVFYRFLRKKTNLNKSLAVREEKWHEELNTVFNTDFWNKTYSCTAEIKNNNRLKWLQFQINRNSLYTNYKVHKFNPQVSPFCTFCVQRNEENPGLELVSHLFESCKYVRDLWTCVGDWLSAYIWVSRLNNNHLSLSAFKKYFYYKLDEIKNAFIYQKKENNFDQWSIIYDSL